MPVEPATTLVLLPGHPEADEVGLVEVPNVPLAPQLVEIRAAADAYEVNAAVLRSEQEMFGELLDLVS